jgi:hypothetical protein
MGMLCEVPRGECIATLLEWVVAVFDPAEVDGIGCADVRFCVDAAAAAAATADVE